MFSTSALDLSCTCSKMAKIKSCQYLGLSGSESKLKSFKNKQNFRIKRS